MDDEESEAEGDDRGQNRRTPAENHVGAADRLVDAVEPGAEDGGNREQERVAGSGGPGEAHEPTGHDRTAGPGDAGNDGQSLGEAVEDALAPLHIVERQLLLADPVGEADDEAEDDEHGRGDPQAAQRTFDVVLEQQTDDDDRDRTDDDEPAETDLGILAIMTSHQRLAPLADDRDDVTPEVDDDGRLGADLDDGGEEGTRIRARQHQLTDDAHMRRGRNGKEFRERLHDSEHSGDQPVVHTTP